MVVVTHNPDGIPLPCPVYLDGKEKIALDTLYQGNKDNFDTVILITGKEGSGKTTFGCQRALYFDPNFNIDNVIFNPHDFDLILEDSTKEKYPPMTSIVWDESDALSEHWASEVVGKMKKFFKRNRYRRLFLFLITPTFFDLNKYFAVHRTNCLYNIYTVNKNMKRTRGFFTFYGDKGKRLLYFKGRQFWDMDAEKSKFFGRFTDVKKLFPIDFSEGGEYDIKKSSSFDDSDEDKKNSVLHHKKMFIAKLYSNFETVTGRKPKQAEISLLSGIPASTLQNHIAEIRLNYKKYGLSSPP